MSELQAEEATETTDGIEYDGPEETEVVETEQAEQETVEPSESAPEAGEAQKITFTEEQQKIFDDAVAKKVFKIKEAERKAEELAKRLEEIEASQPKVQRPNVPPVPDPYDDDYEAKVLARDEAIRKAAAFDAREEARRQAEEERAEAERKAANEAFQKTVNNYVANAEKHGIDAEELESINKVVNDIGIYQDIADHLMTDQHGPLVAKYLAANPAELDKINAMTVARAAVYIETSIKPKATTRKTTSAPPPVDHLRGTGAKEVPPGLEGVIFE